MLSVRRQLVDKRLRGKDVLSSRQELPSNSSMLLVKSLAKKPRALVISVHEELLLGEPPDSVEALASITAKWLQDSKAASLAWHRRLKVSCGPAGAVASEGICI